MKKIVLALAIVAGTAAYVPVASACYIWNDREACEWE